MLNKYDKKYKDYLKLERDIDKLEKKLRKLPLVKLKEPFQKGWIVDIRLRDDVARRVNAKTILRIIDLAYTKSYITNSLKEVKMIRQGIKYYYETYNGKKVHKDLVPGRKAINEKEYENLSEELKSYFYLDIYSDAYRLWNRKQYYGHLPDYYIELRARPNIMTHYYLKGGQLEKELAFLEDKRRNYWILNFGGRYDWGDDLRNNKEKTRLDKFIKDELNEYYNN